MNDAAALRSRIRYTEFKRPALRGIAFFFLLLPVLVRGLENGADRWIVVALGSVSAGNLAYAQWKLSRVTPLWPRFAIPSVGACVVAFAAMVWVLCKHAEPAMWAIAGALLVAAIANITALTIADPIRSMDQPAISQPSAYPESIGTPDEFEGDAIACSGGGIRAAAFCLGGVQRLRTSTGQEPTYYDGSKRVFGVSGGGYIAASLHLARINSRQEVQANLFAPGSPEEEWLRRRSKYLLPSGSIVPGALALLYGIAVNVVLIGLTLFLAAWYAGWLHTRMGGVCGSSDEITTATCLVNGNVAGWNPDMWWVIGGLALLGLGLAAFVADKALTKFRLLGSHPFPLPQLSRLLVASGSVIGVVCVVMPWLIVNLSNATIANEPTKVVAKAMSTAGLATPEACRDAIEESFEREAAQSWLTTSDRSKGVTFTYGACGDEWTDDSVVFAPKGSAIDASDNALCKTDATGPRPAYCDDREDEGISAWERFGAWLAAAGALIATARGLARGLAGGGASSEKPSRLAKIFDAIVRTVLPWAAVVLLGLVVAVLLITQVRDNLVDPDRLTPDAHWLWIPALIAGIRLLTDAIQSSLHPYYRERLSDTFLIRRSATATEAEALPYTEPTHVHQSSPPKVFLQPGPELTVCCVANVSDREYIPAARGCASFLFETNAGGGRIGISDARLPRGRLQAAERYSAESDPQGVDTTIAAAMATSGAAFSPLAGRQSGRLRPYRVLLALVNARLGVWLPNPYLVPDEVKSLAPDGKPGVGQGIKWALIRTLRPGPFRIFKEAFGALSIYDNRIYVTDGGHYDNTGMVEALRVRPRRLVVLDASADRRDSLDALGDAIVTARMDLGLVIKPVHEEDVSRIKGHVDKDSGEYQAPEQGWIHLEASTVDDPTTRVCDIYFVKNVLTKSAGIGLDGYAADNPAFPITATANQSYGEYDFEAYRLLGYSNTADMMQSWDTAPPGPALAV
ncbi:hypothetical protein [Nocardioides sp. WS12]|uniref:hypothetical protein n=1 Tax=Nocardioides sp. WS12 TaxID=2486272 RepID=UPI0015FE4DE5|nr:hypothetical protein [Nocardioides sp. WS12]